MTVHVILFFVYISAALTDTFLLYSNAKLGEVKGISVPLDSEETIEVMEPIAGLDRPIAVDFHVATQFIYYSDATNFRIGRRKVDGSERDDSFLSSGE